MKIQLVQKYEWRMRKHTGAERHQHWWRRTPLCTIYGKVCSYFLRVLIAECLSIPGCYFLNYPILYSWFVHGVLFSSLQFQLLIWCSCLWNTYGTWVLDQTRGHWSSCLLLRVHFYFISNMIHLFQLATIDHIAFGPHQNNVSCSI